MTSIKFGTSAGREIIAQDFTLKMSGSRRKASRIF